MTKVASFLGLIQLHLEWNPDGNNGSYLYKDLEAEVVKTGEQRVEEAKLALFKG